MSVLVLGKKKRASRDIEEYTLSTMCPLSTSSFVIPVCSGDPCVAGTKSTGACFAEAAGNETRKSGISIR